jgi:hypothetical protein
VSAQRENPVGIFTNGALALLLATYQVESQVLFDVARGSVWAIAGTVRQRSGDEQTGFEHFRP